MKSRILQIRWLVTAAALLVIVAVPFAEAAQHKDDPWPSAEDAVDLVSMAGMRSLVPSLLALGWDDFFLAARTEIELTPSQGQRLLSLRVEFQLERQASEERLKKTKLALYDALNRDQVSMHDVEVRARQVCGVNTDLVALRFRSLLRAINVLTHKQHQLLVTFLKLKDRREKSGLLPQSFPSGGRPLPTLRRGRFQLVQQRGPEPWANLPEQDKGCFVQPNITVQALLSYDQGRDTAKRLAKLAGKLRRQSKHGVKIEEVRKLVAQMEPELYALEHTAHTVQALLQRGEGVNGKGARLIRGLELSAIADLLADIEAQLTSRPPDGLRVTRRVAQLKDLTNQWRRNFSRAADEFCLQPRQYVLR